MNNSTTLEELVLYIYDEISPRSKARVASEIAGNWALNEKFQVLKASSERINDMKLQSPRQQTIDAILEYACKKSKVC